jgi:hypothetical protein
MSFLSLYDIAFRALKLLDGTERDFNRASSNLYYVNIIRELQSAYLSMTETGRKHNRAELLDYENVLLDRDTSEIDFRWNSRRGTLVGIFTRPASGNGSETPTQREWRAFYHRPQSGFERVGDVEYRIVRSRIYIMPQVFQTHWRVWWIRQPAPLSQGTLTAGSTTTITLPASPTYGVTESTEDAYAGDYVHILTGPGAGTIARCTASSTSRVLTCEPEQGEGVAFPVAPTSASTYSILPWFPEEYGDALAHATAVRMTKIGEAETRIPEAAAKLHEFSDWATMDDQVSPISIIDLGNVNSGLMGDCRGFPYTWNNPGGSLP